MEELGRKFYIGDSQFFAYMREQLVGADENNPVGVVFRERLLPNNERKVTGISTGQTHITASYDKAVVFKTKNEPGYTVMFKENGSMSGRVYRAKTDQQAIELIAAEVENGVPDPVRRRVAVVKGVENIATVIDEIAEEREQIGYTIDELSKNPEYLTNRTIKLEIGDYTSIDFKGLKNAKTTEDDGIEIFRTGEESFRLQFKSGKMVIYGGSVEGITRYVLRYLGTQSKDKQNVTLQQPISKDSPVVPQISETQPKLVTTPVPELINSSIVSRALREPPKPILPITTLMRQDLVDPSIKLQNEGNEQPIGTQKQAIALLTQQKALTTQQQSTSSTIRQSNSIIKQPPIETRSHYFVFGKEYAPLGQSQGYAGVKVRKIGANRFRAYLINKNGHSIKTLGRTTNSLEDVKNNLQYLFKTKNITVASEGAMNPRIFRRESLKVAKQNIVKQEILNDLSGLSLGSPNQHVRQ
jgi:hypothetical protein